MSKCPNCDSVKTKGVKWTWWGGVLGPKLVNLTKCEDCGYTYNGNTGKPATNTIVIYLLVSIAIGVAVGIAIANMN